MTWVPNPHPIPPRTPLRATLRTFGAHIPGSGPTLVNPDRSGYWKPAVIPQTKRVVK